MKITLLKPLLRALSLLPVALFSLTAFAAPIDREAVVTRHNVHVSSVDPESSLSVGNGDFAFTVDATGLQCFEALHHDKGVPLETLSSWGWHEFPNPNGYTLEDAMKPYDFHGRQIQYVALEKSPAGKYYRENAHPTPLGQISLIYKGKVVTPKDLTAIDQSLNIWTGVITSRYLLDGVPVEIVTAAHASRSELAVRIRSMLIQREELEVRFRFAYSHDVPVKNKPVLIWDKPDAHTTAIAKKGADGQSVELRRTIDKTSYGVKIAWEGAAEVSEKAPHDFRLHAQRIQGGQLTFTCEFVPYAPLYDTMPAAGVAPYNIGKFGSDTYAQILDSSAKDWRAYWTKGGIIDLSGSTDSRARELERRTILSLYLMRVNYAGCFPPSECGLTTPTWFGKHNSEVYFIHAAQFYQWGHTDLLEKGLDWYRAILPIGKADAASKGFDGVRWPKMAGPDARPTPGGINPFIIWNQPNPIYLAELVYRANPNRATLDKYKDLVLESGKFLASYASLDTATNRYVLGPPLKASSEGSDESHTWNPTFELALWYWGLQVAQTWRERLGMEPDAKWADILARLSRPTIVDGKYVEIETEPNIYKKSGGVPSSMLYALGYVPKTPMVDEKIMRATFDEINHRSPTGLKRWVSWAMGQAANTATRLGEKETAVSIVTNDAPAARFMPQGHVRRPAEPDGCPAYMPFNASFLSAVALMAGGWDTAPEGEAPGFPRGTGWVVRAEGLNKMP